jgi:hypothetical protein
MEPGSTACGDSFEWYACSALCAGAASLYENFELGVIPLLIDARLSARLMEAGNRRGLGRRPALRLSSTA